MNVSDEGIDPATARSSTATRTRLSGRWLLPARIAWGVLTALSIGSYVISRIAVATDPGILAGTAYAPLADGPFWEFWIPDLIITGGYIMGGLFLMWRGSRDWLAIMASYSLIGLGCAVLNDTGGILLAMSKSTLWLIVLDSFLPSLGVIALFFLFPDGRFVPRWTRWLLIPSVPIDILVTSTYYDWPRFSEDINNLLLGLLAALLLVGLGSQIYRYRRVSGPTQRQQTKWVLLGFLAFTTDVILSILIYEARSLTTRMRCIRRSRLFYSPCSN